MVRRRIVQVSLGLSLASAFMFSSITAAPGPTRLLRQPTVSATQVAFTYANNLWVVDRSGGIARRLTSFQGATTNPKFSPDGKWIAFSAEYGGNMDVYVVPAEGGEPKRLTWHPGADSVQGWTPDGKSVMFASSRATSAPTGAPRFWTVPVEGGIESPLPLPRGYQGKISPDGTRIAYRMNSSWDDERRNYRGGQNRPIWIVDLKTFDLVSPPWTDSKDIDPVWVGDTVYFISDRDGVANVWAFESKAKRLRQVTKFTDFDVKAIDAGAGALGHRAGRLHSRGRSVVRPDEAVEHHGDGRFPVDDAALGGRVEPADQHRDFADGQARAGRGARGDVHDSGGEGRRAEPDAVERIGRARSGLVARRQVHLVLQRQVRRVPPGARRAGRPDAAEGDRAAEADALLHGVVVARFEETALLGHERERVGARRRQRPGQGGGPRRVDGARADAQSRVEPRFEVGRLRGAAADRSITRSSCRTSRPARRSS